MCSKETLEPGPPGARRPGSLARRSIRTCLVPYWVRGTPPDPQANFQAESPEIAEGAILAGYRELLPWLGYGPTDIVSAYTMDNSFSRAARETGFRTISSLCPGQNFMDGPMRINHFGMPDRPYFISADDFRKPGPGGPARLVGIPQCQRNTFLNREFNCTYCLEPAWNEYYNEGGGRAWWTISGCHGCTTSLQAMLENRLSQKSPYFFSVGLEFNGVAPGITEGNRLLLEYAVNKAKTVPLVFSTGPAVSEYYRRHFARTPETTCYQQDYFGGQTKLDNFPGYPDTIEIEGPISSRCCAPRICCPPTTTSISRRGITRLGETTSCRGTHGATCTRAIMIPSRLSPGSSTCAASRPRGPTQPARAEWSSP